jgi:hypothetical protein
LLPCSLSIGARLWDAGESVSTLTTQICCRLAVSFLLHLAFVGSPQVSEECLLLWHLRYYLLLLSAVTAGCPLEWGPLVVCSGLLFVLADAHYQWFDCRFSTPSFVKA